MTSVTVSQTVKLPAHSVLLLNGKMKGDFGDGWCEEGLIEGGEMVGNPKHLRKWVRVIRLSSIYRGVN